MDYEQIKAIIEARREQWERALKHAEARGTDSEAITVFEASAAAANIILQDIEAAYKAQKGK